jgi:hypothetical protein
MRDIRERPAPLVNRPLLFVAGAIAGAVIALLATKSALSVNVRHEIILPTIRK